MLEKFKKLSPAKQSEVVDTVAHVGDGEIRMRREYDLTLEELENFMLDHGYERCPECNWFVETFQLLDDNSELKPCDNCKSPYSE